MIRINPLIIPAIFVLFVSSSFAQFAAQNGFLHQGNLPNADVFHEWSLTTSEESDLIVSIGTAFSPYLQLFDSNGNLVGQRLGNGGDRSAEVFVTAAPADTYLIRLGVRFNSTAGAYILNYVSTGESRVVASGDEGGNVSDVAARGGSIFEGDLDTFSVSADQGNTIVLRLGTEFSAAVRIFDPDGNYLAGKFSNGGDRTSDLTVVAPIDGTYTVVISPRFSQEGDYSLTLSAVPTHSPAPSGDEGGALGDSMREEGDIPLGDIDFWSFTAKRADRILIRGETDNAAISIRVYNDSGAQVSALDGNGADRDRTLDFFAAESGSYFLTVGTAFIGDVTPYALTLERQRPELESLEINNSTVSLEWKPRADLLLEASDDLEKWSIVEEDTVISNGNVQGEFTAPLGRGFFRFRWDP